MLSPGFRLQGSLGATTGSLTPPVSGGGQSGGWPCDRQRPGQLPGAHGQGPATPLALCAWVMGSGRTAPHPAPAGRGDGVMETYVSALSGKSAELMGQPC